MTDDDETPTSAKRLPNDNRYSQQPPRTYELGASRGPFASKLGPTTVKRLADIVRGGDEDLGTGGKR